MVYTTALVFGHGMPSLTEEESLVEMIGNFLSQLVSSEKSRCPAAGGAARRGSVESCDHEAEKNVPYTDLHSGLEEEDEEEVRTFQRDMTRQLERCLSEAKGSTLPCEVLLLPRHMSARVGRDLVRSSAGEPCGLRGAAVNVYLEESKQDALKPLGSFSPDPSVTPTFELSVVFKVDDDGWPPLKHIFHSDNKVLKLRPEYRLVKRKLYSSASPVVRDFC